MTKAIKSHAELHSRECRRPPQVLRNPITRRCLNPDKAVANSLSKLAAENPRSMRRKLVLSGYSKADADQIVAEWSKKIKVPLSSRRKKTARVVAKVRPPPVAKPSKRIKYYFVIGAGASVDAGIKTFRGMEGGGKGIVEEATKAWRTHYTGRQPPAANLSSYERVLSVATKRKYPKVLKHVWRIWGTSMAHKKPGKVHRAMVRLQQRGELAGIFSMNIDNLELAAGIRPGLLFMAHGNIFVGRTGKDFVSVEGPVDILDAGGPDMTVTLFGEDSYVKDSDEEKILADIEGSVLVIVGVSGSVMDKMFSRSRPSKIIVVNTNAHDAQMVLNTAKGKRAVPSEIHTSIDDVVPDWAQAPAGAENSAPGSVRAAVGWYDNQK